MTVLGRVGTSIACPASVRSRAYSAASTAETTPFELVLSATMIGT